MNEVLDLAKFDSVRFDYHRKKPEVTLEKYHRAKVLETGDRVLRRKAIYLDTCYWVRLRDAFMGRSTDRRFDKLLEALRSLVKSGKVICPFAADLFAEVMNQNDDQCRKATANIIDELSEGIALQPEHERISTEILHYYWRSQRGIESLEPLSRLVWTSSAYVLGFNYVSLPALGIENELAMQKAFTDYMWPLGFSNQVAVLGKPPESIQQNTVALAEKLNDLIEANRGNLRSFGQVHIAEFAGMVQVYLPEIVGILPFMYEQQYGELAPNEKGAEFEQSARRWAAVIQETFQRGGLGTHLPSLVIKSGLAAAVRWNQGRKYKPQDFHDFGHAAAALVHCDFFATERSLHHLVTTELKYDQAYGTTVHSDPAKVLDAISSI